MHMSDDQAIVIPGYARLVFPVDSACFVVLHPSDFAKKMAEANGSLLDVVNDGDLEDDFDAGRVLGLRLGGDGWRAIVAGLHPAPPELAAHLDTSAPFEFRLHVRKGPLYALDPSHTDRFEPSEDEEEGVTFFEVPRGRYHARLHVVRSTSTSTVGAIWALVLEPVETFDNLPAWKELPHEDDTHRRPPPDTPLTLPERWVRHKKFGIGRVLMEEGTGADAKLLILFPSGERRLLASFVEPSPAPPLTPPSR